jgi:hypothetical protein
MMARPMRRGGYLPSWYQGIAVAGEMGEEAVVRLMQSGHGFQPDQALISF